MKNKKMAKGITLIALVITIIVILILAGVTVATLMGENGIINKARIAKEKTNEAQEEEKQQLESLENKLNEYATSRDINANELSTMVDELLDEKLSTLVDELLDDKLNEVETYTLSNDYVDITMKKRGNIKEMKISGVVKKDMTAKTAYDFGTLPKEYRPIQNVYKAVIIAYNTSDNIPIFAWLSINTSGAVTITLYQDRTASKQGIYITETYI